MKAPDDRLVVLEPVVVVGDGLALIVEYRGARYGVPATELQPGTTVRHPGDRGRLVLRADFARRLGIPT